MKHLVFVGLLAILIGLLLALGVRALFDVDAALFFGKFFAAPAGLALSVILFLVYDHLFPKRDTGGRDRPE
jgi:uncharacterized membrane protein YhfC